MDDPSVIKKHEDAISVLKSNKAYKVDFEKQPDGAHFFRVEHIGPQSILYLNTNHAFYREFYVHDQSNQFVRSMLETMLLTLGTRWHLTDENEEFFKREIGAWTSMLEDAINQTMKLLTQPNVKTK